jgi:hypothetical protein
MGVMWALVAAGVVVIVVVVAIVAFRRPEGGDLSSVDRYHSALGTMEQVTERTGSAPVRMVGASRAEAPVDNEGVGPAGGTRSRGGPSPDPGLGRRYPPAPARGVVVPPEPGGPLFFDDQNPVDVTIPRTRSDRIQRHALASMNRRPRRGSAITVVVVVVVVVLALVYIGSRRSTGGAHGHTAAGTPATTSPTRRTTTSTARSTPTTSTSGSGRHGHHGGGKKAKTTPTTPPSSIVASSTGLGVATYPVSSNSFSVTVTATGPCWVLARSVTTGATLWTGTLQNGTVQTIPATGTTTVELGSLDGALKVGTVPVVLPHPLATPFVATFQPATSPPVTPSSSPTVG